MRASSFADGDTHAYIEDCCRLTLYGALINKGRVTDFYTMDKRLSLLINSYLVVVVLTLLRMRDSDIEMPITQRDWASTRIPSQKIIGHGTSFEKRDFGCTVTFPAGPVEIEFSESGRKFGFRLGNLLGFAKDDLKDYGFKDLAELASVFNTAIMSALFDLGDDGLAYLKPEHSFV